MGAGQGNEECFAVEKVYLGKVTTQELVRRIIRAHIRQEPEETGHERKRE